MKQPDEKSAATVRVGALRTSGKSTIASTRLACRSNPTITALVTLGVKTVISLRHRPDDRVRHIDRARRPALHSTCQMNVRGYPPSRSGAGVALALINRPGELAGLSRLRHGGQVIRTGRGDGRIYSQSAASQGCAAIGSAPTLPACGSHGCHTRTLGDHPQRCEPTSSIDEPVLTAARRPERIGS